MEGPDHFARAGIGADYGLTVLDALPRRLMPDKPWDVVKPLIPEFAPLT